MLKKSSVYFLVFFLFSLYFLLLLVYIASILLLHLPLLLPNIYAKNWAIEFINPFTSEP